MSTVDKIAKKPIISIAVNASVSDVAESLAGNKIGGIIVLDGDKLMGIVTETDLVRKVLALGKDPKSMKASEVMTKDVKTASPDTTTNQALAIMHAGNFRHVPVSDSSGKLTGMVSVRDLLKKRIEELNLENKDLENFILADSPGG